MKEVNNTYKQQILHDVQMDTQTTFMNNGDINIYPCMWEQDKAPVTADGAVKATRPWIRKTAAGGHKVGERMLNKEHVYVTFKFPKKYGRALIMSLYQEEVDQIMSYLKTRREETIW